jgi:lysophospholipase L1-like esterase
MKYKLILYIIGLSLISTVITEQLLYSQNNLVQNDNWVGVKKTLKFGVMGSDEFMLSRSSLSRNRLNLSKYWGYQAVKSKKSFSITSGSFNFQVPEQSFLDFYFVDNKNERIGLRLSKLPSKKSFAFTASESHEYLSKKYTDATLSDSWNTLKFAVKGGEVTFSLNNKKLLNISIGTLKTTPIVFHAGLNGAVIDDIVIKESNGDTFTEPFNFKSNKWAAIFLINILALFVLFELFVFILKKVRKIKESSMTMRSLLVFNLLSISIIFYAFDYYYWSSFEDFNHSKTLFTGEDAATNKIEKLRFELFRKYAKLFDLNWDERSFFDYDEYAEDQIWRGPILCSSFSEQCVHYYDYDDLENNKYYSKFSDCKRMVFMGSSQTAGSGASEIEKTFFALTHKSIHEQSKERCTVSLNLSSSGSYARKLLRENKDHLRKFKPHLAFINLSSNDELETFERNLSSLVEYNQSLGIENILLKEPNSIHMNEDIQSFLGENHKTMDRVANNYNLKIYDIHSALAKIQLTEPGIMWWDYVHMSDLGQELAAEWLSEKFMPQAL